MKITKEDKSALSKRTFLLVELYVSIYLLKTKIVQIKFQHFFIRESETDPLKLEEKQLEILLKNNLKTIFGEV